MTELNGKIVFSANDGIKGTEIWEHDPVTGTTGLVDDVNPNAAHSYPGNFTRFQDKLYFVAQDGTNGSSLFEYDGVNIGRIDINLTGAESVGASAVFRGDLYIAADDGSGDGRELFVTTDGVTFTLVQDINPIGSSAPYNFVNFNNNLVFVADNGTDGKELFEYDGTSVSMIDDINPTGSSFPQEYSSASILDGKLYFEANDGTFGSELHSYDGSTIIRVGDVRPGAATGGADDITAFDGKIYFEATDGNIGLEMWSYDEEEGLNLVADILPGSVSSQAEDYVVFNNTLYFTANSEVTTNQELWAYGYL